MTKEELFPKERYPLRARAELNFPEKRFKVVTEVYYQEPPFYELEQTLGLYTSFVTDDGTKFVGAAQVISPEDDDISYLEKNDNFEEMDLYLITAYLDAEEAKFEKKYGVNIHDEETNEAMSEKMESAQWESF